jgi:acetolactate decarboxylase
LEAFLLDRFGEDSAPFFFRLTGVVKEGVIHVVNLPEGTVVSSPEQAHQGLVQFSVADAPVSVLGFFSTKHQTIFTHHDTFIHAHLLTDDHRQMGHLDEVLFAKGSLRLWVPAQ